MENKHTANRGQFHRELLPPPKSFYERELGKLSRPNCKAWSLTCCPFHQSRSRRSFSVNLVSGAFHCFGCDARGGDVVSFLRQRDHLSFKDACQQLGAWNEDGRTSSKPRRGPLLRFLVLDYVIDGVRYRAEIEDEPKNDQQRLRRFYAAACDRLSEIFSGDWERFEGEEGIQWGILAHAWQLLEMEASR